MLCRVSLKIRFMLGLTKCLYDFFLVCAGMGVVDDVAWYMKWRGAAWRDVT